MKLCSSTTVLPWTPKPRLSHFEMECGNFHKQSVSQQRHQRLQVTYISDDLLQNEGVQDLVQRRTVVIQHLKSKTKRKTFCLPGTAPTIEMRSENFCFGLMSRPYASIFCPSKVTSLYPCFTNSSTSSTILSRGRDCSTPRVVGTMQNAQRSLQPYITLHHATWIHPQ